MVLYLLLRPAADEGAAAAGVDLGGEAGEVVERAADRGHGLDDRRARRSARRPCATG